MGDAFDKIIYSQLQTFIIPNASICESIHSQLFHYFVFTEDNEKHAYYLSNELQMLY